ncbi:MAG: plasmid partitioning protein RepB [Acidobacteria bacterium]|nr:plasmid partitioning protein RepB [Acidobacteriota bacterium]
MDLMRRKELVSALLKPEPNTTKIDRAQPKAPRVTAGSVRAMGLELDHLTQEAEQANVLREQLASGTAVVELDPKYLEPSFVSDRLAPTDDPQYRQLVETIRTHGQQLPILVRPHPKKSSFYQIAYGHRRWYAARELAIKVRAIVQDLSDTELVVAQGKENSQRRNLSFIERALFAASLDAAGFERSTINAALAVQTAETSRLLAVAAAVPAAIVKAIGPAPKAGRTRWMELAEHLETKEAERIAFGHLEQPFVKQLGTDARFETVLATLRTAASNPNRAEVITNMRGEPVVRVTRSGPSLRLWVDGRFTPGFCTYLLGTLPDLVRRFDEQVGKPRDE